jgi:hypothetical protein
MPIAAARFRELLGFEDRGITLVAQSEQPKGDYVIEHLRFRIGEEEVRGILTRPSQVEGRLPAILYGHSHGGGYAIGARELLDGREYLVSPLGPVFARAGYVTLCIDMPIFGERATVSESFAAKKLLWHGKCCSGRCCATTARPSATWRGATMSMPAALVPLAYRWAASLATGWPPSTSGSPQWRISAALPISAP